MRPGINVGLLVGRELEQGHGDARALGPEPGRGSTPAAGYPGTDYPGPDYPSGAYAGPGHAGSEYPAGDYPVPGDEASGPYSGTEYPGPDYPAPENNPGRRAHVAWGREPADEPGEDEW